MLCYFDVDVLFVVLLGYVLLIWLISDFVVFVMSVVLMFDVCYELLVVFMKVRFVCDGE